MPSFELGTFTVGTFIGILLGTFIGHALAIRRGKFLVKHSAALELKKAFQPALLKIKNGDVAVITIWANFEEHQAAAMDYSRHLSGSSLKRYLNTIHTYTHWYKIMCDRPDAEVMYGENDPEYLAEKGKDPVKLINKILKHANT